MRLIVVALVLATAGMAHAQPAEDRASASLRLYSDDDQVVVMSPSAGADAALGERLAVDVAVTADVITAASVDVVTAASPEPVEDQRIELGAGVRLRVGDAAWLRGRAIGSREHDFVGVRAVVGGRAELARRNTTIDLDYALGRDWIGHAADAAVDERRWSHRVTATMTQVVDRRSVVDLTADAALVHGYQASPYRSVPIVDPASTMVTRVPEATPRRRASVAALLRGRRALGAGWFVHADYRAYGDDWGLVSHTASARGMHALSPRLLVGLQLRAYLQSAADFHRRRYLEPAPALRTADRALGRMRSAHGGAVAEIAIGEPAAESLRLVVMIGAMRFWWLDYAPQATRDAVVVTIGVRAPIRRR